jgi:hypothetical protein
VISCAQYAHQQFNRCAQLAGLILPDDFLLDFESADAVTLLAHMNLCFHVAGTISPLVVLIPTQWASGNIGREHLLTVNLLSH